MPHAHLKHEVHTYQKSSLSPRIIERDNPLKSFDLNSWGLEGV